MAGFQVLDDNQTLPLPFPASTAISKFDLLYWDTTNKCVQPMSHLTPGASEAADQATIGPLFIGVSADVRLASEADANGIRTVIVDGIFDYDVTSAYTPALGDMVSVTRNGGSALVNQVLTKVTIKTSAIDIVINIPTQTGNAQSWGSVATKVRVRLTGARTYQLANHP